MHSGIFSLHKLNTLFSHTYYRYIPYCIYSKNVLHFPMCGKQELMAKLTVVKRLTWQISFEQTSHWIKSYLLIILIFFFFFFFFSQLLYTPKSWSSSNSNIETLYLITAHFTYFSLFNYSVIQSSGLQPVCVHGWCKSSCLKSLASSRGK